MIVQKPKRTAAWIPERIPGVIVERVPEKLPEKMSAEILRRILERTFYNIQKKYFWRNRKN